MSRDMLGDTAVQYVPYVVPDPGAAMRREATRYVLAHSRDDDDATQLLEALGLIEVEPPKRTLPARAPARPLPTHCKHGHPYTGDNLAITKRGYPRCRQCDRDGKAARKKAS